MTDLQNTTVTVDKDGKPSVPFTNIQPTLRKLDSAPSTPDHRGEDEEKKHRQIPVDLVEEESMESFPASDPPSHHHSNTSRPDPRRPSQLDDPS